MYQSCRNSTQKGALYIPTAKTIEALAGIFSEQIQLLESPWQVKFSGRNTLGRRQNEMY